MSSNNILADLQPQAVFKYFEQICAIPHGSGKQGGTGYSAGTY